MEVKACKKCGNLFNYLSGPPICPACKDELEKKFHEVKEFVRENPGATMQRICEEHDVTQRQIQQWVREERLEFSEDSPVKMSCEACGKTIRTGRYCDNCKNNMASNLANAFRRPVKEEPKKFKKETDAMRFLH